MSNPNPENQFKEGENHNPTGAKSVDQRISTYFKKSIEKIATAKNIKEYDAAVSNAQAMSDDFVESYWTANTIQEKKAVLDTIMDRTEGKPQQAIDHTTNGQSINVFHGVPPVEEDADQD